MKITFLVKYYDNYQKDFLKRNPNFSKLSYDEMIEKINTDYFVQYNSYVYYLRQKGYQADIIIPNFKVIQEKWAIENKIQFNKNWDIEIAQKQIQNSKPDILFLNSNFEYFDSFLESVKPFTKKICAWISCPFDKNMNLNNIDFIFTLFKPHFDYFQSINKPCFLTQAGFDPRILNFIEDKKSIELSFIGGIGGFHKKREKILKKLIKKTPIQIWGYGYKSNNKLKNWLKTIKNFGVYNKVYKGQAWGIEMFSILHHSKITFNSHGDIADGHAVNMRMFEATGVGTLLITEYTKNIKHFFEPDKEIICYKNKEEAIEKINYYLKHNKERKKIAKAGQLKTHQKFSHEKIVEDYITIFISLINQ